uniref:starch synthase n=1 Tax=Fagus sylvatica TaxID=28930 RepID=A0A2N9HAX3_FAGSY
MHFRSEGHDSAEMPRSSKVELEVKQNEIWGLFREAQQNILYLNKQRLMAVEALNKANREKQLLLDRIEQLEAEKQAGVGKDKLSLCWELLLRIDSMLLTGMISTGEASDLRRLIMDHKVIVADVFNEILLKKDAELLAELRHFSDRSKKSGFHIVHICTEMSPLISVGSLASYVTGLSHALQRKGHLVEVILPNVVRGIGVSLIQPLYYSSFFSREKLYGYSDDFERFTYFSRASLDYIAKSGKQPDVLHIHNWETAIVGPLFWDIFVNQCLEQPDKISLCGLEPPRLHRPDRLQDNTKAHLVNILKGAFPDLFSIAADKEATVADFLLTRNGNLHWEVTFVRNLQDWEIDALTSFLDLLYSVSLHDSGLDQLCWKRNSSKSFTAAGESTDHLFLHCSMAKQLWDTILIMFGVQWVMPRTGGIVYSNKVVIMSSMHSKSRIISSFSHGLDPTLSTHKDKLVIAPYGFDNSTWDPSKDNFLPENYRAEDMKGKAVCKVALQQHLALSDSASTILIGCIFTELSDIDLENLKAVVRNATRRGVQVILMEINKKAITNIQELLKDQNVRFINRLDEAILHLVFAGSDIILCQSFDDPVLQVPHKALKYGAAPIAMTSTDNISRYFVDPDYRSSKFSQFISSGFGKMSLSQALDEIV